MKNKVLTQLVEWIDSTPQINRKLLKEKIEELDNASVKKTRTTRASVNFIPPTIEQVKSYCLQRRNNVDAEAFVDHYASKGWVVGKVKMKDWQAAVRTWERNNKEQQATSTQKYGRMNEEQAYGTFSAANNVKIPGT